MHHSCSSSDYWRECILRTTDPMRGGVHIQHLVIDTSGLVALLSLTVADVDRWWLDVDKNSGVGVPYTMIVVVCHLQGDL